jgi:hypothetical protein
VGSVADGVRGCERRRDLEFVGVVEFIGSFVGSLRTLEVEEVGVEIELPAAEMSRDVGLCDFYTERHREFKLTLTRSSGDLTGVNQPLPLAYFVSAKIFCINAHAPHHPSFPLQPARVLLVNQYFSVVKRASNRAEIGIGTISFKSCSVLFSC